MKILIASLLLSCFAFSGYGQKYYLGIGGGINQHKGLTGLSGDFKFDEQYALRIGAGIGSWGTKVGLGFLFKPRPKGDWRFGLGYSTLQG